MVYLNEKLTPLEKLEEYIMNMIWNFWMMK